MGNNFKGKVIAVLLIAALGAALWYGLKWFGGVANDNAGGMDGGASKYEQQADE